MKGLTVAIMLAFLNQMSGVFICMIYGSKIIASSNVAISPNGSIILLALAQFAGNLCTTKFVASIGRKVLLKISLIGSSLSLFSIAACFFVNLRDMI